MKQELPEQGEIDRCTLLKEYFNTASLSIWYKKQL